MYAYVLRHAGEPTEQNPIIQSYLDVVLTGCIQQFGEAFAEQVLQTTSGLRGPILNDRERPRYPRALERVDHAQKIDQMLSKTRLLCAA